MSIHFDAYKLPYTNTYTHELSTVKRGVLDSKRLKLLQARENKLNKEDDNQNDPNLDEEEYSQNEEDNIELEDDYGVDHYASEDDAGDADDDEAMY